MCFKIGINKRATVKITGLRSVAVGDGSQVSSTTTSIIVVCVPEGDEIFKSR